MIEKELEQDQVVGADLSVQEQVVTHAAVDVLDDRTGADDAVGQIGDCLLEGIETVTELWTQRRFFLPTSRLAFVDRQQVEQFVRVTGTWNSATVQTDWFSE